MSDYKDGMELTFTPGHENTGAALRRFHQPVEIDLSAYDIKDGDEVRVETDGGEWKVFVNGVEAKRREGRE